MAYDPNEQRGEHGKWTSGVTGDSPSVALPHSTATRPTYKLPVTYPSPRPGFQRAELGKFDHLADQGWNLLSAYPDNEVDDVGSWLLHHNGEAMLLEVPPGLDATHVRDHLNRTGSKLKYVTASHSHHDHFDWTAWKKLKATFPEATFIRPHELPDGDSTLHLGGEPVHFLKAPKHSPSDHVTVFKGLAHVGDVELGTLNSVNKEVPRATKAQSTDYYKGFPERSNYHVHSIVSAHLNDYRQGVHWPDLFNHEEV